MEKISVDIVHNVTKYNPPKFSVTVVTNDQIGSIDVIDRIKNHYSQTANFLAKNDLPLSPLTMNISKEASTNFRYNGIRYTDLSGEPSTYIFNPVPPKPTPGVFTLIMKDSYGDGWQGCTFDILDLSGTSLLAAPLRVSSGSREVVALAASIFDGSLNIVTGDDLYKSEVSWELYDESANKILSGGALYDEIISFPLAGTPFDDSPITMTFKNPVVEQPENITINGKWYQFMFSNARGYGTNKGYLYLRDIESKIGYIVLAGGSSGTMMKINRVDNKDDLNDASNNGKLMFYYDETKMNVLIKGSYLEYSIVRDITEDTFDPSSNKYSTVLDKVGKATYCNDTGRHRSSFEAMIDLDLIFVTNENGKLIKSHPNVADYGLQNGKAYLSILKTNDIRYFINSDTGMLADRRGVEEEELPTPLGYYLFSPSPKVVQGERYFGPPTTSHQSLEWIRYNAYYRPNLVNTWRGLQLVPFNYKNEGTQNILHAVNGGGFNAWAWQGVKNSGVHNSRSDLDKRFGTVGCLNSNFFTALLPSCSLGDDIKTHKPEVQCTFDSFNFMVAGHEYTHTIQQGVQGGWMGVKENGGTSCCGPNLSSDSLPGHKHVNQYNSGEEPKDNYIYRTPKINNQDEMIQMTDGIWGVENIATFMEKMSDYSPNNATPFRTTGPYKCLQKVLDGTFLYDANTMLPSYDAVSHTAILEDYIHIPGNNNIDGTPKREYIKFNFDFTNDTNPIVSKNNKPALDNNESIHDIANQLVNNSHDNALTFQAENMFYWFKKIYGYTSYDLMNQAFLYAGKDNSDKVGLKYQILETSTKLSMLYNVSQRPDIPDKYKISENSILFDLEFGSQFLDLPLDTQKLQMGQHIDNALANLPDGWFNNTNQETLKSIALSVMSSHWGSWIRNDINNFRISRTLKNHFDTPITKYGSGLQPGKAIVDTSANSLVYSCDAFSVLGLNKFSYALDASGLPMVDASDNLTHESNVSKFSIKVVSLDASDVEINTDLSGEIVLRLTCFNKKSEPAKLLELQTVGVEVPFVETDVTLVLNGPKVEIDMYTLLGVDAVADKSDYNINCMVANLSENSSVNIVLDNIVSTNMEL